MSISEKPNSRVTEPFTGAKFEDAFFNGARFMENANIIGATFEMASFIGARFNYADFK